MTLVMPLSVSEEDTDGNEEPRESSRFKFFQKMLGLNREIILCAVLLTSYAAVRNMNQTSTKNVAPKPFFLENPWVTDFYHGEIFKAFGVASKADITFVMFYAPWDADCQRAKPIFEKVARYYHNQVFFMAVNCWEPSSVCKAHFNDIERYPVFIAYLQRSKGIEYQGIIDFAHMVHFLSSVISPLHRVHDLKSLYALRNTHDAVVLGYIPFYGMLGGDYYHSYYKAALKFLERDPRRDVAFAIITDQIAGRNTFFSDSESSPNSPALKLFLWDTVLKFEKLWNHTNIINWVHENMHSVATWAYPPGTKSNLLGHFLNKGPTLILFTPRNMFLSHSYEYNLLKLAAMQYFYCSDYYSTETFKDVYMSVYSLFYFVFSDDQWESSKSLKHFCSSKMPYQMQKRAEIFKTTKWKNSSLDSDESECKGSWKDTWYSSCVKDEVLNSYFQTKSSSFYDTGAEDILSAESLLRYNMKSDCRKFRFALDYLPEDWLENEHSQLKQNEGSSPKEGLACKSNVTLSFLAMDSLHFDHFAKNLGVNLSEKYGKNAVFIIDAKAESIYHLNSTYISLDLLETFIHNFTEKNLPRFLRSSQLHIDKKTTSKDSIIETIFSNTFHDSTINNNRTVLVYFYSPFCAYSRSVFHSYISLANTLRPLNNSISFTKIDGENNDLQWPFMMDKFPSILLFPSSDKSTSKLFDRKSQISVVNLAKFILYNLDFELRAQVQILFCLKYVFTDYNSVQDCINFFKLSNIYYINHYNNELRNLLIHFKLQNEFKTTSNSNKTFSKGKTLVQNVKNHTSQSLPNLVKSVNKIKCKLLYFQIIYIFVNNANFNDVNKDSIFSSVFKFYRIYLTEIKSVSESKSNTCGKLYNTLNNLQGDINYDYKLVESFQKTKQKSHKILNMKMCQQKGKIVSECQNSKFSKENVIDSNQVESESDDLFINHGSAEILNYDDLKDDKIEITEEPSEGQAKEVNSEEMKLSDEL